MIKILRVGDPHVRPANIEESNALFEFVVKVATENKVDRIELMGDLFHTHNLIHLSVLQFWDGWLDYLKHICNDVVVLVGNHDMSGDASSTYSASSVLARIDDGTPDSLAVIDAPVVVGKFIYAPYMHDKQKFVERVNALVDSSDATVLVCHDTFQGSKYDNGMYAPDGVDPTLLSPKLIHIISGHIHSEQDFGRVIYPGTGRWDTASDANRRKGIWLYEHGDDGRILRADFISTAHVCSPIISIEWREGEVEPTFQENSRTSVELIGSSVWINAQKIKLKGKVAVRTKVTDKVNLQRRTPGNDIQSFIFSYFQPSPGISKESVIEYMKELKIA